MHMSISFYVLCLLCSFYHVIVAAKGTRGCKSFAIVRTVKNCLAMVQLIHLSPRVRDCICFILMHESK